MGGGVQSRGVTALQPAPPVVLQTLCLAIAITVGQASLGLARFGLHNRKLTPLFLTLFV